MKDLLNTGVNIALIGLVVWLVQTYLPMPPIFSTLINLVVVIGAIIWLLRYVTGKGQ